jgi:hypothetical protein
MVVDVEDGPPSGASSSSQFNSTHSVAEQLYSLLDEVDSESIAEEFGIGKHSKKHDFDNHLKIGIFEGVNPSDSLDGLAEKTATHEQLDCMAGSTVSRRTNDRAARSFVSFSNYSIRHSCITNAPFSVSVLSGSTALLWHLMQQTPHSPDSSL